MGGTFSRPAEEDAIGFGGGRDWRAFYVLMEEGLRAESCGRGQTLREGERVENGGVGRVDPIRGRETRTTLCLAATRTRAAEERSLPREVFELNGMEWKREERRKKPSCTGVPPVVEREQDGGIGRISNGADLARGR